VEEKERGVIKVGEEVVYVEEDVGVSERMDRLEGGNIGRVCLGVYHHHH
jgi:hypothetical protein